MNFSDTANQLLKAVEACVSRYQYLAVNGLDKADCSREAGELFSRICEALHSEESRGRSRLLSALYSLVYGAFPVPDTRMLSICYAESEAYLRENFGKADAESLCRCLMDYYYPEGDSGSEWFEYLKDTMDKWLALPPEERSGEQEELLRNYGRLFGDIRCEAV